MRRRTFLASVSIGLTAGCVDLVPGGRFFGRNGTRIKSLRAVNYRSKAQTFHAKLSDGGETTYERTIEVPGLSDGIPGGKEFSEVPADPQTGQLTAYIKDQSEQEWKHLSLDEIDADCVKVKLIISHIDNKFGIWYTVDCNDPSDPPQ